MPAMADACDRATTLYDDTAMTTPHDDTLRRICL